METKSTEIRFHVLRLTPEQEHEIRHLLNQGQNIFGELRLCNQPGEQSAPHIFLGLLTLKAATAVRKTIEKDSPTNQTL